MRQPRAGDLVRIRSERWAVLRLAAHAGVSVVTVRGAEGANAGRITRFVLPFEPVDYMPRARLPRIVRPGAWRRLARAALTSATPTFDALRSATHGSFDLLPYQLEPALAIIRGRATRVLIADDVGLGKTVQAGMIVAELLARAEEGRALVVCPASLRRQWQEELRARFALPAVVLDSAGLAHVMAMRDEAANPWSAEPLIIASIDFIKRPEVVRALEGLVWDVLVLDEAHHLASRSDRATAAAALAGRARTVVLLSATPHSGDEAAFTRLCAIGDIGSRFPLTVFRRTRADVQLPTQRRTRWLRVQPTAAERLMHATLHEYAEQAGHAGTGTAAARLAIIILLKRAASSAYALGRSLERRLALLQTVRPEPDPSTQLLLPLSAADGDEEPIGVLAAPALANARDERAHLERLLRLARLASARESKLSALGRWVGRVREPLLIFTEYRDTLTHVHRTLLAATGRAQRIVELHGGLTTREQEASTEAFVTGHADILLATDAASEGVNLHHRCRCVLNLECPWTPTRLEQRIGRVDRLGQRRRIHAVQLVAAGTFETGVVARLQDRAQRAAAALAPAPAAQDAVSRLVGGDDGDSAGPQPVVVRDAAQQAAATSEAERIGLSRRLVVPGAVVSQRPVATVRRNGGRRRTLWAFEVVIMDADGAVLWSTLVGVEGAAVSAAAPADVRSAARALLPKLQQAIGPVAAVVLASARTAMAPGMALGIERERAIAAGIRRRQARLAADLVQPGLFDRRAERRAAAQALVFDEALGRCMARLDEFARRGDLTCDPPQLRLVLLQS